MKEEFDVDYPALPGFTTHSLSENAWRLEDYVDWLRERIKTHRYDALVGYSFGGAMITKYLAESNIQLPAVLVSPAILRRYKRGSKMNFSRMRKFVQIVLGAKFVSWLRHVYMMVWVRNKYYIHGTRFLRNTYLNIVDVNLSNDLVEALRRNNNINLIFGAEDSITPPSLLFDNVPEVKSVTTLIPTGGHHIGTTHPQQLFEAIRSAINNATQKN